MSYKVNFIIKVIQSWIAYLQFAHKITNNPFFLDQIEMYKSICNYLKENYPLDKDIEFSEIPRISNCMLYKLIERYEIIKKYKV